MPQHLVPQPIPLPLQQQPLVTVQPMQPMQPAQAKLKWLLEQVHVVRSRSVKHTAFDKNRHSMLSAGLSQQCRHNKEEKERLHKICNDYKARKVCYVCVVLAQPCETWEISYCR